MTTQHKPVTTHATEYLTRALALLEQPRPPEYTNSWIRHAEAIAKDGKYCSPEDERAVAWCTIGAVRAVTYYDPNPTASYTYCLSILNAANPQALAIGSKNALPNINDQSSFERVRRLFQRAITLSERLST